jgi:Tfp pilus assembly protein PilF
VELAGGYQALLDDRDKMGELMEQAAEFCMSGEEYVALANGYWELQGDAEKAAEAYEKALGEISDKDALLALAKKAATELNNPELAKTIYAKAEARMSSASELSRLAQAVVADLQDKDYAAEIYRRAAESLVAPNDLINLATDIVDQLADKVRAGQVYRKALEQANDFKQLLKLLAPVDSKLGDKAFAKEILEKAQQLVEASPNQVEIAKHILQVLGDKDLATRVLEQAEESVTSLGELRTVTETVKEFFGDNADWVARIEEKLSKREANQDKYNAFQARENQAHTVLDYLRLADAVISDLDDAFYARKLLTSAEQAYGEGGYDFTLGRELVLAIDRHLKDKEWVQRLLDEAAARCTTFVCVNEIAQTALALSNKRTGKKLAKGYYKDWDKRLGKADIKGAYDYTKLAKVVARELADSKWAGTLLNKAAKLGGDHLAFAEMGLIASGLGDTEKAAGLFRQAMEACQDPTQLIQLAKRLKAGGMGEQRPRELYAGARSRWEDRVARLAWVEGIVEVFRDAGWAAQEYDALAQDFASAPEAARFEISRRSHLHQGLW